MDTWQSQSYRFKEIAKKSNFEIKKNQPVTHLKLVDKMCKYEMDLASIVEDTEWTPFCPQMDRRPAWWPNVLTERQMDGRTSWYQNTPFNFA